MAAPASEYAGAVVCKGCHAAEYESQSATPHARALQKSTVPKSEWAFGAPVQATTYVSQFDADRYVEHRLTFYVKTKALAPTPGHQDKPDPGVLYRIFSPGSEILRCFQCHSTGPVSVSGTHKIEPAEPGVRCEVCHGPGAAHAKAPSKKNIGNPARFNGAEQNQFCGSCHRKPTPSGDDTDFRDPWNARHQPLFFDQAKCFKATGGKLNCVTCHPPHGGATKSVCAGCHPAVKHLPATRTATRTCESCHMPLVKPQPELAFANHWIAVYGADPLVPLKRKGR